MPSHARKLALICCLASLIGLAACGAQPPGASGNVRSGLRVTRCDGSSIAHANLAQPPVPAPAAVYFGTKGSVGGGDNGVFALAAHDGAPRWCARFALTQTYHCPPGARCPAPPIAAVGRPLLADGVAYVCVSGGAAGVTYAFNASDGALRWSRETGCRPASIPFGDDAQPILASGTLYSGAYGLAPTDGAVRWHLPTSLSQTTIGAVANGVAYVYGEETISAVRLADSAVAWTFTLDAPIGNRPVPADGRLYVGDIAGDSPPAVTHGLPDTYALDLHTGAVLWRAKTGIVASSAAVAGGLVYLGAENTLDALDPATGAIRWRITLPHDTSIAGTPVIANNLLYFVGDGAYAVDATTGAVRWHTTLSSNTLNWFAGPALNEGTLYLGGMDGSGHGSLYALDATTGALRWSRPGYNQVTAPTM